MKVVHLATIDCGGAYKAAVRISESMQKCGVDSEILLRTKMHDDASGTEIFAGGVQKLISKAKNFFNLACSKEGITSEYFGTNVSRYPMIKEADIIVLHWVNSFISYKNVEQLMQTGKPVVWVMHDMWLFTGGCHVDQYCGRYAHHCGKCPYLNGKKENDISRKNFLRKVRMMDKGQIVLVGPSRWIVDCARKSRVTQGKKIVRIPNPINEDVFYRRENREELRKKYHLPINKKIILCGAMGADRDENKGMQNLSKALYKIPENEYMVVVFGNKEELQLTNSKMEIRCLGVIGQEQELAEIYNCADVFLSLSKQDNYPNVVLEALACGVPVAAFAIGGIVDQIKHKENGYLVSKGAIGELSEGILWCAEMKDTAICEEVKNTNGYQNIGEQYKQLLQNMVPIKNKKGKQIT